MTTPVFDIQMRRHDLTEFQMRLFEQLRHRDLLSFDCAGTGISNRIFCMTRNYHGMRPKNNFGEKAVWFYSHRTAPKKFWMIFDQHQNKDRLEYCLIHEKCWKIEGADEWYNKDGEEYLKFYTPQVFDLFETEKVVDLIENYLG